jgi:glycosyltransferase involved in cell wall biosynthesis
MSLVKVLHIATSFGIGGAEKVISGIVNSHTAPNITYKIYSILENTTGAEQYEVCRSKILGSKINHSTFFIKRQYLLFKEFYTYKPDVIHAHMFHGLLFAIFLKFVFQSKIVFTSHCNTFRWNRFVLIWLTKYLRDADVIFHSGQHLKLNNKNSFIIPNAVKNFHFDNIQICKNQNNLKFIFVGRFVEQKNPLHLIFAFEAAHISGATLTMVGDGPLLLKCKEYVDKNGLERSVFFAGNQINIRGILRKHDVFVMHSRYEGLPMAALEAATEGLPIISTPVGGLVNLLSNDRGFLVNEREYSSKLKWVGINLSDALRRASSLKQHIENNYSYNIFIKKHENLYLKLIGR